MSVSRPARCLFSGPSKPSIRLPIRSQRFHTSPTLCERRRPRYPSVKASEMGLVTPQPQRSAKELFKPYEPDEKEKLSSRYTPQQIEAIEAGEAAIDIEDLRNRGVIRSDWGSLPYLDDFSKTRSVVDHKQMWDGPVDPNARLMNEKELGESIDEYHRKVVRENPLPGNPMDLNLEDPEVRAKIRPNRLDLYRIIDETPDFIGMNGPIPVTPSALAPGVPMDFETAVDDEDGPKHKTAAEEEEATDPRDPDGIYDRLRKETGLTLDEILSFKMKTLVRHRVVNQTRLGKVSSQYVLVICGDGNGRLGLGQSKGQESEDTSNNARIQAIKNMRPIPRYEQRTIYGEVEAKVSAVKVKLMSRPPGFGVRCQYLIFEMARAAGIQDLAAKVPRSRNKMNTVKATYEALMSQRIPDEVARGRGKKLVDVRKVYYGGRV
ncbi:putative 37S ribosomal protein S5, mitochondrial [Halenospora varia]|nr:putative 37S ribosomal protein S5, mitochondrial [Halenospora varia]